MYTTEPRQVDEPDVEFPVFSTVNVSTVDSGDVEQELGPFPPVEFPSSFPLSAVDPGGIVGTDTDAVVVAVHAIDPGIGFPILEPSDGVGGPGNPEFFDSAIGFTVLEPGAYTDVEVPIFPFDGVGTARGRIPGVAILDDETATPAETYPPNPDGETEVLAQLWTPAPEGAEAITPYGFDIRLLTVDGEPARDGATVTALDQTGGEVQPIQPVPPISAASADTATGW